MAEIDFSKYRSVDEIVSDIKDVTIQGATNVAISTFEGLKIFLENYDCGSSNYDEFIEDLNRVGYTLAYARPNEPLAKNGLKYVMSVLVIRNPDLRDVTSCKEKVYELCDEFLEIIRESKEKIIKNSEELPEIQQAFTHCHSSTATKIIYNLSKRVEGFKVVCTETRPLYQGRITAKKLLDYGLDTTLIADSAASSFIIDKCTHEFCTQPIDIVFLGSDEITMNGEAVNKIGSWGIALAAYFASKPVYVVSSILKTEVETAYRPVKIEYREASEIWEDAPEGLKMVNPSFELINSGFITGFITEFGIIKPNEIASVIQKEYQWLF
jgi:ribose 1,5-bisphosphate isomerase